ncbi:MAG: 3-oxoacyl-ACP synthase [Symbiobacteriaceae bacterium]|nr:3-oxoacyl-ACP synthase [Symbiobacteriaceae bacterium]
MLNVKISALGTALPQHTVSFGDNRRFRISEAESHLGLLCESAHNALADGDFTIDDIDLIIGACGVGLQPIPCTAALVHRVIAPGRKIPALDINTTCSSFITALDMVSYQIEAGCYKHVLIVSGDVGSIALNEGERNSFELLSDAAVSAVISRSGTSEILYATQSTWSSGAHLTQLVGGGTVLPAWFYDGQNKAKYQFHMEGKSAMTTTAAMLKELLDNLPQDSGLSLDDIDMIIPHQASLALGLVMRRLGIPPEKFIDITREYGNMVSASVPFTLNYAIDTGKVKRGDTIMLLGSAAGLTLNAMILRY